MKRLIYNLALVLSTCALSAQSLTPEVVASAGETFSNGSLTLEWTLGEIMTETYTGDIILTQGFHQPDVELAALPVEFLFFRAKALPKQRAQLDWRTSTESNNSHFIIERRVEGSDQFEQVGEVAGAGNAALEQAYVFIDEAPYSGLNYYRLRQTDFDGQESLSNIATVSFQSGEQLVLFPNPATDFLSVQLPAGATLLGLLNVAGQATGVRFSGQDGQFKANISELPAGVYFLQVQLADRRPVTHRFVVH
ncbi:MAG: T9SS type A sorting domain-containing protein [Bacteroidota bacterium]